MRILRRNLSSIKIVLLGIVLTCFSSCDIDVIPEDRFVEGNVWTSKENVDLYVNGLYAEFKKFQFGVFPNLGYDNHMDALSDIMKFTSNTSGNGTVNLVIADASRFSPSSIPINYWSSGYERIRRINEFLEGLQEHGSSVLDEKSKKEFEAQARVIRAYCYFWLAKLHGSVVLLKSMADYNSKDNPRASEQEVYDFMLEDLDFAAASLPVVVPSGKLSKGAALAFKARVSLYAASVARNDKNSFNSDELTGIPENLAEHYFKIAENAAKEVIELGEYELEDDFNAIFSKEKTSEEIFGIHFSSPAITHQFDLGYAPPKDAAGQTLVYGVPTAELVDAFEMEDGSKFDWSNPSHALDPYKNREPRFYGTILYHGASWKDRVLNTSISDVNEGFIPFASTGDPKRTVTGFYIRKYLDEENSSFVSNRSNQSWIEIRFAEMYLILAEAQANLNKVSEAVATINILRNKRKLPNTTFSTLQAAMSHIEYERMVELAFEGHRYWDLRRWRKAHILLNDTQMSAHKISIDQDQMMVEVVSADASDRQFPARLYYLPIPDVEVQINESLKQIKGW